MPGWVSEETRRAWRRLLVILALLPILVLVSTRIAHLAIDPLLGFYGLLTLGITAILMYRAFVHYRDPSVDPAVASEQHFVSCMVAVKDEVELIESCVRSILDQDYANIELIVVDDGSTDGTGALLDRLAGTYPALTVLHMPDSGGKKSALAVASAHARGSLFLYSDSDSILAGDAVARVVDAFNAHPDFGAVCGHARALNGDDNVLTRMQDSWYEGQFSVWKAAEASLGAVTCLSGPLAAFRREAVVGFLPAWTQDRFLGREFKFATDRQLTGYLLADERVSGRLLDRHRGNPYVYRSAQRPRRWKVGYVKSARVWTNVPDTFGRFVRQQVRWKKSFLRNLAFTGSFYWRRGALAATVFYAHILFVVAMPLMWLRHIVWLPAHGQLALTGIYLAGVTLKGGIWALAYKAENPGDRRWVYRPLMSLMTALFTSCLLVYSAATLRRQVWHRG